MKDGTHTFKCDLLFKHSSTYQQAKGIGAAFIPSLALAFGTWSGSSKLFEVTYLLLWYVGLLEHTPSLDFAGISAESITRGIPWVYFGVATLLLGIAVAGRTQQLKN
jgi:hypothetical protein